MQLIETDGARGVVNEFTYNSFGDLISTTIPNVDYFNNDGLIFHTTLFRFPLG